MGRWTHSVLALLAGLSVMSMTGVVDAGDGADRPKTDEVFDYCLHCEVTEDLGGGRWDLEWGDYCDPLEDPDCANCLAQNLSTCQNTSYEEDGIWWDGPCDVTCCDGGECPHDVDFQDSPDLMAVLQRSRDLFIYKVDRDLLQVLDCSGKVARSTPMTDALRSMVLLAEVPQA